jgi:hypothetical protein
MSALCCQKQTSGRLFDQLVGDLLEMHLSVDAQRDIASRTLGPIKQNRARKR